MMSDFEEFNKFYLSNFSDALDTFENCSYDSSNNLYLCHSKIQCFNFDKIKDKVCPAPGLQLHSVDSIYFCYKKETVYFVEFKNQKIEDARKNFIESCKDSYFINRFISTFANIHDFKTIHLSSLLVVSECKNSNYFVGEAKLKLSNKKNELKDYQKIDRKLRGISYLGETLFYSEFKLFSESQFDCMFN